MSLTPSTMLPLGTQAPDFKLPDTVSGNELSLQQLQADKATIVMFICNHCPYVVHIRQGLIDIANDYQSKGVQFVAINSNDIESYPDDSPENMKKTAEQFNYPFPYLFDGMQAVAKAYQAACTPDFYIFDSNLACVYRGQFDDSSPGKANVPVTGKHMRAALDNILAGKPIDPDQKPSQGCNIKWKS